MNEPHENLDPDPFADDAARRPSRLRRAIVRHERPGACGTKAGAGLARSLARRQVRLCPRADRNPLR
jgi:hypothetical protein